MTCYPAEVIKPGQLLIHFQPKYGVAAKDFVVTYNPKQFGVTVEKIPLTTMEDKGILDKWGDTLAGQVPFSGNLLEVWGKVSEQWGTYSLEAEGVRIAEWLPNQVDFEIASRRLREGMQSYPAYAGGRIFLRNEDTMACYRLE